jgi:hypothetical protein
MPSPAKNSTLNIPVTAPVTTARAPLPGQFKRLNGCTVATPIAKSKSWAHRAGSGQIFRRMGNSLQSCVLQFNARAIRGCGSLVKKAMAIDHKTVQKAGIDDPDLKPLWDSMSGTIWKKE